MKPYTKLTRDEKLLHHENHLKNADNITNIISAQATTVCIRNIKQASAHQKNNINVHLYYSGNSPNDFYGYGNQFYSSITKVNKKNYSRWKYQMQKLIQIVNASLIHTHNEPDFMPMKIMSWNIGLPIIYDQHDLLSAKKQLRRKKLHQEKYCNENNHGAIYITDKYRDLVSKMYSINPIYIDLPNYGSSDMILNQSEMLPKLTNKTTEINLVYIGAIDQEDSNKTRYLINEFKLLSEKGFNIHIYPSKNSNYDKYNNISNVSVYKKQNPKDLIKTISKYDYGLTIVNPNSINIPEELKFGFWNKTFDYLLAGIPQITLNIFTVISQFIIKNKFGISVQNLENLNLSLLNNSIQTMNSNILRKRSFYTYEYNITKLHNLYKESMIKYHSTMINNLNE